MNIDKDILKKKSFEFLKITIGVAISAFAFSFFLNPRNLVIGGVSGIGIILKHFIPGFDPAVVILILNILLLLLGLILLGKDFFIKTAYGSIIFPVFIFIFDRIYIALGVDPDIQNIDMVLLVLFSSVIMGIGLGTVVKHGGTTGGTEVIQKILYKYLHLQYSTSLYILDGIVIFAGLLTKVMAFEVFLYAIVFTFTSGVVADTVIYSGFNRRAVYIISNKGAEIKSFILHDFERGLTTIKVIGEYTKNEREMLVCVMSSSEYYKLRSFIEKIDPNAFYYAVRASEVRGEGFTYE